MFERPAITDIVLTRVNFSDRLEHVLDFTNVNEQTAFFDNLPNKLELEDATFQRKDMYIRMDGKFDTIQLYNYGWFHNHIENMRFYFFIENVEYASDNSCLVYIKIDPWQTYQFQLKYTPTFIERKHVTDDVAGNYTIMEQLEIGEYINNKLRDYENTQFLQSYGISKYVCIGVSEIVAGLAPVETRIFNGVYSGVNYILFKTPEDVDAYLDYASGKVGANHVVSMFMIPDLLAGWGDSGIYWVDFHDPNDVTKTLFTYSYVKDSRIPTKLQDIYVANQTTIDGYTPRNKKLLTYPYNFFVISNGVGSVGEFHYELFNKVDYNGISSCKFEVEGSIGVGCSIRCNPINYDNGNISGNINPNYLNSIDLPKLPVCAYTNDVYKNWLTQNGLNITTNAIIGTAEIAAGLALSMYGGGMMGFGLTGSGVKTWASMFGEINAKSKIPPQAYNGTNQADYLYSNQYALTLYKRSIKQEYAKIIDFYFDKYGYKVNIIETPSIKTRKNWNYIKTIDINFYVDTTRPIPQAYEDILKSMFDNGVTIWHNYQNMYNYNSDNSNL